MISVNVPETDADKIRLAAGDAGAGQIGNYSHGSFSIKGIGRGKALDGANPAIGKIGALEEIVEEKIEFFCKEENVNAVVTAIKAVHPYEQPIITLSPVEIA